MGAGETPDPSVEASAIAEVTATPDQSLDPTVDPPSAAPTGEQTQSPLAPAEQTPLPTPATTPEATPQPTQQTTPLPSVSFVGGREASDQFWNWFYQTCFFGAFDLPSLREIYDDSTIVIRGPIAEVRQFGTDSWLIELSVLPTEVLKGEPIIREDGTVAVQISIEGDPSRLPRAIPSHENLWFLYKDEVRSVYYDTDYAQTSIVRDIDGLVRVIQWRRVATAYSENDFPARFEGTDFEALVQKVRDLAGTSTPRLLRGADVDREGTTSARALAC